MNNDIERLAQQLDSARQHKKTIEPLTQINPQLGINEAYQIQLAGIALREAKGEKRVGYKMGLTSAAKQQQMGVDTPIFGILTNVMQVPNNGIFSLQTAIQPKIEPEIAFILEKKIDAPISINEALAACSGVCAAMDLIDSRFMNFKFALSDVIADNCSASHFVLGPIIKIKNYQALSDLSIRLNVNNKTVASGSSAAILQHPLNSLVALSKLISLYHLELHPGDIVLSGAATQAIALATGMHVQEDVESLGQVNVQIK